MSDSFENGHSGRRRNTNNQSVRIPHRNRKYLYRGVCVLIYTFFATAVFYWFWHEYVKDHNNTGWLLGLGNLGMATGIYMVLYLVVGRWLHAFKVGVERKASVLAGQVLSLATVAFFEIFISCAITGQFRYFWDFVRIYALMFLFQSLINGVLTIPMINLYRRIFPPLQLIEIVGQYRNDLTEKINAVRYKYHICEKISCEEEEETIRGKIDPYDAVLLNDLPAERENRILKLCFAADKRVYFVPKISDVLVRSSEELNLFDTPLFMNRNNGFGLVQRGVKRFCDVVLSALALGILSPILLVTAIAIKAEDHGPVFYRQERVTLGGRHFMILKFRSMIVDAEKDGRPHPAEEKDDRITRVGHVIRACRVDELPQLINILKGDMSIVGPRPERWEHCEMYRKEIPEWDFRNKVRGGLTGYAQVYGKYNTAALDKLKLDLIYITNFSILLDLQIIFETLKILFLKESTEGFTEERISEMEDKRP